MKTLRFNFCHPIKGVANLIPLMASIAKAPQINFDSKNGTLVEIPLINCTTGRWRIVLNWEYEDQLFVHQKEFELNTDKTIMRRKW